MRVLPLCLSGLTVYRERKCGSNWSLNERSQSSAPQRFRGFAAPCRTHQLGYCISYPLTNTWIRDIAHFTQLILVNIFVFFLLVVLGKSPIFVIVLDCGLFLGRSVGSLSTFHNERLRGGLREDFDVEGGEDSGLGAALGGARG